MNNLGCNMYCIIQEDEKVNLELLDTYLYLLQKEEASSLKIWYKDLLSDRINMLSIKNNAGDISSCIGAIDAMICKEGLIGLDYSDAFQYMGGESGHSYFSEYIIRQENDGLMVLDVDNAKAFCKRAKQAVVLIDGWYSLSEAQEILKLLECDNVEIAFQVHVDESKKDGKLFIWISS